MVKDLSARLKPQSAEKQSRSVAGESTHPHQDGIGIKLPSWSHAGLFLSGKGVEDSPNQEGDNRQDLPHLSARFWQGLQKSVAGTIALTMEALCSL